MAFRSSRLLMLALAAAVTAARAQDASPAPAELGTKIEMPYLIAPMSSDGKLLGYAYISMKLEAASPAAAIDVRRQLAFIQDAYVRDVNANSIAKTDDPKAVDKDLLGARLTADARRIVGQNKVTGIVFLQIQYSPLHPGDTGLNAFAPNQALPQAQQAAAQNAAQAAALSPAQSDSTATSKPAPDSTH